MFGRSSKLFEQIKDLFGKISKSFEQISYLCKTYVICRCRERGREREICKCYRWLCKYVGFNCKVYTNTLLWLHELRSYTKYAIMDVLYSTPPNSKSYMIKAWSCWERKVAKPGGGKLKPHILIYSQHLSFALFILKLNVIPQNSAVVKKNMNQNKISLSLSICSLSQCIVMMIDDLGIKTIMEYKKFWYYFNIIMIRHLACVEKHPTSM